MDPIENSRWGQDPIETNENLDSALHTEKFRYPKHR
jgi:hypothetical protein